MTFIFPTELEATPFREVCPTAQIEICGVGAAACSACITSLVARGASEPLILAGIAGCYSFDSLMAGDVVEVVGEQIYALPEHFRERYEVTPQTHLRAVSSNTVNGSDEGLILLGSGGEMPDIENMEGAPFFAICKKMGVQALEIRAISNHVGAPFETWSIDEALYSLTDALLALARGETI